MITILNWILGSVQEEKELDICNVSFIYFSHFRDENTLYSRATLLELD